MRRGLCWVLLLMLNMGLVWADEIIESIRYQGLNRYTQATLAPMTEIAAGQLFSQEALSNQIKAYYATQYFETIKTQFDQGVLTFKFKERPVINEITFDGNAVFSDKQLEGPVENAGIKPGRPFKPFDLQRLIASLQQEYRNMGYLNATVTPKVKSIGDGKVVIDVHVDEKERAFYHAVKFDGNHVFTSRELKSASQMEPWSIFTYFSGTSIYSQEKFDASIKSLYEFYYDHGYLNFDVVNKRVTFNKDKTKVDVAIKVFEGKPYTLTKITINSPIQLPGSIAMMQTALEKQPYSRVDMLKLIDAIQDYLKDAGYAYANIKPQQQLNSKAHTISVKLDVKPEKIYQIRKIEFHGNDMSNTTMLRRYLYLNEGERFSKKELENSKNKLMGLGYFENVVYRINPVPGFDNMVDIDYSIVEKDSVNSLMAEVGYGRNAGVTLGSDLNFKNFFGTGNQVTLGVKSTQSSFVANLSHVDPFFTDYAITRSTNFYYTWVDSDDIRASDYRAENIGASMMFGLPMTRYAKLDMGVNVEHSIFKDSDSYSSQVQNFIDQHGSLYNNVALKFGLSHSLFESSYKNLFNASLEVGLPIIDHYITYYTFNASDRFKVDLYKLNTKDKFSFEVVPRLGYGQGYDSFAGDLPFFKMFHAGGYGSIRNYKNFSLGPRDSKGDVLGGDMLTTVSTNLYFPLPFIDENPFKTALFLDFGNVFKNSFNASDLRGSYGLMFLIKMGQIPVGFTVAQPINGKSDDSFNVFDFALGIDF